MSTQPHDKPVVERADELIGDLTGLSWEQRQERYLQALRDAPAGIATLNQPYTEANEFRETSLRAEIKKREAEDRLNPVHGL